MSLLPAAVLFDLDGTLVDTAPDFVRVLNDLRLKYGRPALAYDAIRVAVSAGARAMIQVGFPEYALDSPEFAALRQLQSRLSARKSFIFRDGRLINCPRKPQYSVGHCHQ